jgi:hypothetical protein
MGITVTKNILSGLLRIKNGLALSSTLQTVSDDLGTDSPLRLSTITAQVTGTAPISATSSLLGLGSAIAGGNAVANGGTYFGINSSSSFVGDFANIQKNGSSVFKISSVGKISFGSDLTLTSSGAQIQFLSGSGTKLYAPTNSKLQLINSAEADFNQLYFGTTSKPSICQGAGSPEASQTAAIGSIYMRSDGGVLTSVYVKQSGAGNTGWLAIA